MIATSTTLQHAGSDSDCFLNLDEIRDFATSQAPRLPPRGRRNSSGIGAAKMAIRRDSKNALTSVPQIAFRRGSRRGSCVTSRVGANKIPHRASTGYTVITSLIKDDERAEEGSGITDDGSFAPWFHGIMSRLSTEQRLTGKASGTFLVRVSESHAGYSLSLLSQGAFRHFIVDQDVDERYRVIGKSSRTFASLNELVAFHQTTAITERGDLLGAPCPRPAAPAKAPAPRWDSGFCDEDDED